MSLQGYYRRGAAYLAMGKFKEALKDFQQVHVSDCFINILNYMTSRYLSKSTILLVFTSVA
jgi:hypothetical protein